MNTRQRFDLKGYLAKRRAIINSYLAKVLAEKFDAPADLIEAIKYSVLGGGKRLRPVLVLAATEACGGRIKTALPAAAAVELIHAYSLIHDDLPAMDNATLRRGRTTNHRVFGEATAILAGDALMPFAIRLIIRQTREVGAEKILRVIDILTKASGIEGMVGGQAADLAAEGRGKTAPGQLLYIHEHKTGTLLSACTAIGAVLAGAGPGLTRRLTNYGRHLGLTFQIIDDILDVTGLTKKLGKKTGQDAAAGKATYPAVFGLKAAQAKAAAEIKAALACLKGLGPKSEPLQTLAHYFANRKK